MKERRVRELGGGREVRGKGGKLLSFLD